VSRLAPPIDTNHGLARITGVIAVVLFVALVVEVLALAPDTSR